MTSVRYINSLSLNAFIGKVKLMRRVVRINANTNAKSLQSCPTLCDPIDGSPPGSAVSGILQARTLEWVAISLSPLLSPPGQPLALITLLRSQERTPSPISGIRYCLDNCLLLFLSCSRAETPHHLLWTEQWPSQIHLLISYPQCDCIWR